MLSPNYTTACVGLLKVEVQLTNAYSPLHIVASVKDGLRNRMTWDTKHLRTNCINTH